MSSRSPELPPRSPALAGRTFLLSFDVDCGFLLPEHRLIARGLQDDGLISHGYEDGTTSSVQGFSLEYELAPGVVATEPDRFFQYLVRIEYSCDVDLPWEPADGGAIAPFEGGASTHGSRGTWPLPAGATRLTFTMYGIDEGSTFPRSTASGELIVDLGARTTSWSPVDQEQVRPHR